jgi:xanthine dehydrogenase accessory factor
MPFAPRAVLEASAAAAQSDAGAVLALVVETEGSTYVRAGAAALFGAQRVGWLSGGCLEPEIAARSAEAAAAARGLWLELDTRDDEDLFAGSALGCRGRLRLVLLPLALLPGWRALVARWLEAPVALLLSLQDDGALRAQLGEDAREWRLAMAECPWARSVDSWELPFPVLPRIVVFGAGPETPTLLPTLRGLGWKTLLVERRARWQSAGAHADLLLPLAPADVMQHSEVQAASAALVMHHHFEFDREALAALATAPIDFIGLLGPRRRRDDLLRLLPAEARDALQPRLRAPVGIDLGGHGPEAIALSIAAQLQGWRHGRD